MSKVEYKDVKQEVDNLLSKLSNHDYDYDGQGKENLFYAIYELAEAVRKVSYE